MPAGAPSQIRLGAAELVLLPCGALWWPAEGLLAVADLHLEKASSFARAGHLLPPWDSRDTLQRLERALADTGARRLLALGDSFHDPDGAKRLEPVARARLEAIMARVHVCFIAGNHDAGAGADLGAEVAGEVEVGAIAFRHAADRSRAGPEVSGHFHPKVRLAGGGRRLSRRCFARFGDRLVLPAYGSLAGGLWVAAPAIAAALGGTPDALVPTPAGLLTLGPGDMAA